MEALKNKRLNEADRSNLVKFARAQIEETQDRVALNAAYEMAADAIHTAVEASTPHKDMKVLERYKLAHLDPCVFVSTGGSNYERFTYRDGDSRIALRPDRHCNRQPILLTGLAETAFDTYFAADKADKAVVKARLADFSELIYGAHSFNKLAEIWPAVEAKRAEIVGTSTALSVLSSEVFDRLKSDPAFAAVGGA